MKKYHFQENEKDFGSTVRLDAINDKVKEIKKKEETDELGDANEFLNVFESEKFDDPAETDGNTEDALVDTLEDADALEDALGETRRDGVFPAPAAEEGEEDDWEDDDEEYEGEGRGIFALGESFGLNKKNGCTGDCSGGACMRNRIFSGAVQLSPEQDNPPCGGGGRDTPADSDRPRRRRISGV